MANWDSWKYMTRHAAVIPFESKVVTVVDVDGMLSTCYYESRKRDRLELALCGDNPTHDEFIRMFAPEKKVVQILCEVKNQGTAQEVASPVGFCWVEMPKGKDGERGAMCGFCFFRRTRYLLDLGRLGLYYWFNGLKINVLHGVMLQSNDAAIHYAKRLGFKVTAYVPRFHSFRGRLVGAVASNLQDVDFLPTFMPWYEQNRVAAPK